MFFRIAKYSIKNILRNKFLSLSSILVLTLLMFFINILFVLHQVSLTLIGTIGSKLTISLYLDEKYDKNSIEIIDLMQDINKALPNINVEYKAKESILDEIRIKEPDLAKILERTNPLPNTIVLSEIDLSQYESLNRMIENKLYLLSNDNSDKEHFSNYTAQYKKIEQVINILHILQMGLYVIILVFIVSISIIIYSVIGNFIYYYRDEIYITRLVGGSKFFIYGPFSIQGAIYSGIAFLLSLLIFVFVVKNVNLLFNDLYSLQLSNLLLLLEMVLFVVIGGLSGFFSSRRYFK